MHPLYIVGFEVFIVIMFGAFVRLDTSSPTSSLNNLAPFTGMLTFLLGNPSGLDRLRNGRLGSTQS